MTTIFDPRQFERKQLMYQFRVHCPSCGRQLWVRANKHVPTQTTHEGVLCGKTLSVIIVEADETLVPPKFRLEFTNVELQTFDWQKLGEQLP